VERRHRVGLWTALPGLALIAIAAPGHAQPAPEAPAARVDRLFAAWQAPASPGCSVGVSRGGATILERGYGTAHVEHGVPITPASVFHVASITKPFTALSILLLARDGTLSLDDDVRRHLPEWAGPPGVTIRHLLSHTSGIRDTFVLIEMAAPETRRSTHEQFVDLLARQRGLSEPPGRRQVYNNGGYVLLAEIVKRVSGQTLRAFADARIFQPLGMRQTHMHDDTSEIVPALATGYTRGGDGALHVARLPGGVVGNAGLFTTVGDLLRWQRNFAASIVGDAALFATMATLPSLPDGKQATFALGLQIDRHAGRRTVGHGGWDPGASAYTVHYPDHDLAVAVLCNLDEIGAIDLARQVADVHLGEGAAPPAASEPAKIDVSASAIAANEGLYRDPTDEALLRIFVRDGALRGSSGVGAEGGWPLIPIGPDRFLIAGTTITLEFSAAAGGGRGLRVSGERPTPAVLERVASYTPSAAALAALAGDYRSNELSTTYTLRVRDGQLIADVPGRASIALQPIRPDTFAGSLVDAITFARDRAGRPTGFTVHAYAARGVRFDRVAPVPSR
jgi:CubicO group peptidase (beta-lactamase class C family)